MTENCLSNPSISSQICHSPYLPLKIVVKYKRLRSMEKKCVLIFPYGQNDQVFILSLFMETYNHVHFNIKKCFSKYKNSNKTKLFQVNIFFSWTNFIPWAFLLIIKLLHQLLKLIQQMWVQFFRFPTFLLTKLP